jgi:NADH-quinone oxidoreductase subunit L
MILDNKYGFDTFNQWFFAGGARLLGGKFWRWGDVAAIDGVLVNGTARMVGRIASVVRHLQSGYIYHYAFAMIIGVLLLATWFVRA